MGRHFNKARIPVGTQVIFQPADGCESALEIVGGAVGEVVSIPARSDGRYQVRFPSGIEFALERKDLEVRRKVQKQKAGESPPSGHRELLRHVAYRCIVGSRAYGLETNESDTDRRGFYVAPAQVLWSFAGAPEQLENQSSQECYWEVQKFLVLALRANPNVLECLYTPLVELADPIAKELLKMRQIFLSKLVYQTYSGYVVSQFKKLSTDMRNKGTLRWKHPMHLIRLLLSGITVLTEGFVPLRMEEHRADLLAIRRGEWKWREVNGWRLELHNQFDRAFARTRLPETPDFVRAGEFLLRVRRMKAAEALCR